MTEHRPNLNIVPPQSEQSQPRHQVLVGVKDGWPLMELVDNQTGQRIAYDFPTALTVAANMTGAVAKSLEQLREQPQPQPQAKKPTLLGIDGTAL